jgi:hypothetical protein
MIATKILRNNILNKFSESGASSNEVSKTKGERKDILWKPISEILSEGIDYDR